MNSASSTAATPSGGPPPAAATPEKGWRFSKAAALAHWRALCKLPSRPKLVVKPIPSSHKGSTYGYDGIRIEGSRAFIDGILARLPDLLDLENGDTRLNLNYTKINERDDKPSNGGDCVCYVKIHKRS